MREECMFCSAYGRCGFDMYSGFDGSDRDVCDWALERQIEKGRLEFYDAWQEYIQEYE